MRAVTLRCAALFFYDKMLVISTNIGTEIGYETYSKNSNNRGGTFVDTRVYSRNCCRWFLYSTYSGLPFRNN